MLKYLDLNIPFFPFSTLEMPFYCLPVSSLVETSAFTHNIAPLKAVCIFSLIAFNFYICHWFSAPLLWYDPGIIYSSFILIGILLFSESVACYYFSILEILSHYLFGYCFWPILFHCSHLRTPITGMSDPFNMFQIFLKFFFCIFPSLLFMCNTCC